jgi:hypothetical protein
MTVLGELGDDLRADEPGATDDYDLHPEPPVDLSLVGPSKISLVVARA